MRSHCGVRQVREKILLVLMYVIIKVKPTVHGAVAMEACGAGAMAESGKCGVVAMVAHDRSLSFYGHQGTEEWGGEGLGHHTHFNDVLSVLLHLVSPRPQSSQFFLIHHHLFLTRTSNKSL